MNKKYALICLAVLAVLGALFTAQASNMLFDDLFNKGVAFENMTLVVSLPAVSVATMLVLGVLWLIRTYKHPDCKKRITRLYLIIAAVFGLIGLVGSILGGALIYGTFTGSHPFPGYLIIFMVLYALILCGGAFALVRLHKLPDDEERFKVDVKHVFKTIGWFLFICLAIERLGLFVASPVYIYWRNFYMTFPFYIFLLVPAFLGTVKVLDLLGYLEKPNLKLILSIAGIACTVVLFVAIAIPGILNTAYVSSVSTAMPLERLASKPLEILIHLLSNLAVGIILLVQALKARKQKAE